MSGLFFFTNGTAPSPPSPGSPELDKFVNDSNVVFLTSLACYGSILWEVILRSPNDFECIYKPILRAPRKERRAKIGPAACFIAARIFPILCAAWIWGFYTQSSHCEIWAHLLLMGTLIPSQVMHLSLVTRTIQLTSPNRLVQAYLWALVAVCFGVMVAYASLVVGKT